MQLVLVNAHELACCPVLFTNVDPFTKTELFVTPIAPALRPTLFKNVEFRIARLLFAAASMAPARQQKHCKSQNCFFVQL